MAYTFCGNKEKIRTQVKDFMEETDADELFITNYIYDKASRFRSFELLSEAMELKIVDIIKLQKKPKQIRKGFE